MLALVALLLIGFLGVIQVGSASLYAKAAAPVSIAAHIPRGAGDLIDGALAAVIPRSFANAVLAEAAIERNQPEQAETFVRRMQPSPERFDLQARIEDSRRAHRAAVEDYLRAMDFVALKLENDRLRRIGRASEALDLQRRLRERLLQNPTHPDEVAESYWRSGVIEAQLAKRQPQRRLAWFVAARSDYARASELAPFSTKYLLAAGVLSLKLNDFLAARSYFERSNSIDPGSADALAGLGIVATKTGDAAGAIEYARRSRALDPNSRLLAQLVADLR